MNINDIGLFSALKTKMSWLSQRQKLVAENVANASTPGFKPKDLKPLNFAAAMNKATGKGSLEAIGPVELERSQPLHMAMAGEHPQAKAAEITTKDSETTMDGNSVVLEEEMLKMADSRMQFEAAIGFYQKSLDMLRLASKAPGR